MTHANVDGSGALHRQCYCGLASLGLRDYEAMVVWNIVSLQAFDHAR